MLALADDATVRVFLRGRVVPDIAVDALHHASYRGCDSMASFDDQKFVRRVKRLGLMPRVVVPD